MWRRVARDGCSVTHVLYIERIDYGGFFHPVAVRVELPPLETSTIELLLILDMQASSVDDHATSTPESPAVRGLISSR